MLAAREDVLGPRQRGDRLSQIALGLSAELPRQVAGLREEVAGAPLRGDREVASDTEQDPEVEPVARLREESLALRRQALGFLEEPAETFELGEVAEDAPLGPPGAGLAQERQRLLVEPARLVHL